MKEFWKTGVLALLLAGIGSYIWFVERKQEPKPEGEQAKITLLTLDKAKAKELKVTVKGGDSIDLVKEGSFWKLTAPFAAPADTSAVDSMFTSLEKLEADELVADQVKDFAQYGLDAPSRSVQAVVEGASQPLEIDFGAKSPDGGSVYARKSGEAKVYLVASWIEGSFDKKPFDLRDRDLLHVKRDDVRSLEVTGPEGSYALARTEAGEWAFTQAARDARGPLVGGRPARHDRGPAHGVGRGRERDRRQAGRALRAREADSQRHARHEGRGQPHARARRARARSEPHALAHAVALPHAREEGRQEGREAGAAEAHPVLRTPGRQRPRGGRAGGARRRPRQGHGRAARQAPAGGRDLRDRRLRGDGRRARRRSTPRARPRTRTASTRRSGSARRPTRRSSTRRRSRTRSSRSAAST